MFAAAKDESNPHGAGMAAAPTDPAPPPDNLTTQIRSVSVASSIVRSDRVVAVTLGCLGGHRRAVKVESLTPGFEIDMLPERARQGEMIILGVRIHRRLGTVRRLCLVRFSLGGASAVASITVLH